MKLYMRVWLYYHLPSQLLMQAVFEAYADENGTLGIADLEEALLPLSHGDTIAERSERLRPVVQQVGAPPGWLAG